MAHRWHSVLPWESLCRVVGHLKSRALPLEKTVRRTCTGYEGVSDREDASEDAWAPDGGCPSGNLAQCPQLPSASTLRHPSQQRDLRRPRIAQRGRALAAAVLTAAILTLTGAVWPDLIDHLSGAGGDTNACPVCVARYAAGTGLSTTPVTLVPTLLFIGLLTLQHQPSVPAGAIRTFAPRAPPTVG